MKPHTLAAETLPTYDRARFELFMMLFVRGTKGGKKTHRSQVTRRH